MYHLVVRWQRSKFHVKLIGMVNTTHETGVQFDGDRLTNKSSLCLVSLALLPVEQRVIMDGGGQVYLSLVRP